MKIAYVGCRTTQERNARGKGISVYSIENGGSWRLLQCLRSEKNPSYQCIDSKGSCLYSVHGDTTKVSGFRILADGTLEHLNTIDIGGRNPVDITLDRQERFVIAAALQGGAVYTIRRQADGSLGGISTSYCYEGKEAGQVSMVHQCCWDRDKRYLFTCTQGRGVGYGQLRVLRYDEEQGMFSETDRFMAEEGDEPRHVAITPDNRWLYLVEEKGSRVLTFAFDDTRGTVTYHQCLPTVPNGFTGYTDASEIRVAPAGQAVLVSNRYSDLMAVYPREGTAGRLGTATFVPCEGKTPRFFCFDGENLCYVANEDSDNIAIFRWDGKQLAYSGHSIKTPSPVCITLLER